MTITKPAGSATRPLAITAIVVAALLLFRNSGLYPTVFADEYTYSKLARLIPFAEAHLPGYLYLLIFRLTNYCGDGFLECARILNVIFFVGTAPLIYLVANQLSSRRSALLISVLSIASPISSYTAYFMPESLYYFCFWGFAYCLLSASRQISRKKWLLSGLCFGLLCLVKPHALFLLPAIAVYFLAISYWQFKSPAWTNYLLFFAMAIGSKLIIGFLLAGSAGITLFGPRYSSLAPGTGMDLAAYLQMAKLSLVSLKGHLIAISLLFPLPMVLILLTPQFIAKRGDDNFESARIIIFFTSALLFLLVVVAFFTASVSDSGPYESIGRLHLRYYNFIFPALLMIAASRLHTSADVIPQKWRILAVIPVIAAIIYASYGGLTNYSPSFVDSPLLQGLIRNGTVFNFLCGLSGLSLALYIYSERLGSSLFIYLFIPLTVLFSSYYVNQELRLRMKPDVYNSAGLFARHYLDEGQISKTVVVGPAVAGLLKTLFHLDDPSATLKLHVGEQPYDLTKIPEGKEWVLAIGNNPLPANNFFQVTGNGFGLTRISGSEILQFDKSWWPGIIRSTKGLALPELWGTWSIGDEVVLEFNNPLPRRFKLTLVAHAFGSNVDQDFTVSIGSAEQKFKLALATQAKTLTMTNPNGKNVISITIPSPVSPKEMQLSEDIRRLGIGLVRIEIEPLPVSR